MQSYKPRLLAQQIKEYARIFPVVGLLGPRQCGKSTLAREIGRSQPDFLYIDLEKPSDIQKLNDPELFFRVNHDKRICIDEIQLWPDLFPVLRALIDEDRQNGKFLLLGSASRDLIRQGSETLAGRIGYLELTPFLFSELAQEKGFNLHRHWLRGGFPESYLQSNDRNSAIWRENFIRTFVERDIPQLGYNIPAQTSRRFLTMCAHNQGQLLNSSKLGNALGVSYQTIRSYLDFMEQVFLLRTLPPYEANVKKRLVKSPKVYVRDAGLLHQLLGIEDFNALLGHPVFGSSWEGYVLENVLSMLEDWNAYFYRTATGNEVDLVLEKGTKRLAVEIKAATAPKIGKGLYQALEDLDIGHAWVIAPVEGQYPIHEKVTVASLSEFLKHIDS